MFFMFLLQYSTRAYLYSSVSAEELMTHEELDKDSDGAVSLEEAKVHAWNNRRLPSPPPHPPPLQPAPHPPK